MSDQESIQRITQVYQNVQEFVDAYAEWLRLHEKETRDHSTCNEDLYSRWICCPKHLRLQAENEILKDWGEYYSDHYKVPYGGAAYGWDGPNIFSKNWFMALAEYSGCSLAEIIKKL